MEGGRFLGITSGFSRMRPPSSAIVPFRPPTSQALVPLGRFGRPVATPSLPPSYYQNLFRSQGAVMPRAITGATAKTSASRFSQLGQFLKKGFTAQNIANALAAGIPIGMLAAYLSDQSGASGDAGYYEDFAGEDFQTPDEPPFDPNQPTLPPMTDGDGGDGGPTGGPSGSIPSDLSPSELAWYLQSGNLPTRYSIRTPRRKRGKGKLTIEHEGGMLGAMSRVKEGQSRVITQPVVKHKSGPPRIPEAIRKKADGRSARAGIVRDVMRERGVSLAEASKIVKAEGLY